MDVMYGTLANDTMATMSPNLITGRNCEPVLKPSTELMAGHNTEKAGVHNLSEITLSCKKKCYRW